MHNVVVLALPNLVAMDLIIPIEFFSVARDLNEKPVYDVKVCATQKSLKTSLLTFRFEHSLEVLKKAQTIVIPGTFPIHPLAKSVREGLIRAHARGVRIISICSGAFHLAETGLLNGRSATTHWNGAELLQSMYPQVKVDPNVLFVDEGQVMTSAGVCAGIDLCLHVIRKDFGAAIAAKSARLAVVPLERAGGQAQFIDHKSPELTQGSLTEVLEWMERSLHKNISVDAISKKACMSVRTLNRQFLNQTGTSPLKWILKARVRRARVLLETTQKSMDEIAQASGFGSPITMREHFKAQVKISPRAYRESFQKIKT